MAADPPDSVPDTRPDAQADASVAILARWTTAGLRAPSQDTLEDVLRGGQFDQQIEVRVLASGIELLVGPVTLDQHAVEACVRAHAQSRAALVARFGVELSGPPVTELRYGLADAHVNAQVARDVAVRAAPALLALVVDLDRPVVLRARRAELSIELGLSDDPRLLALAVPLVGGLVMALVRSSATSTSSGTSPSSRSLVRHDRRVEAASDGSLRVRAVMRTGRPVLRRGRLTRMRATDPDGQTTHVWAQQSLTALAVFAHAEIASLISPPGLAELTAAVEGSASLPIDRHAEAPGGVAVSEPERESRALPVVLARRRPRAGPPTVALISLGAPPAPVRQALGFPAQRSRAPFADDPHPWRVLLRVGRAMSRGGGAEVVVCPWYQVRFAAAEVQLPGPLIRVAQNGLRLIAGDRPLVPDAMFFYPNGRRRPAGDSPIETAAIDRLAALGRGDRTLTRHGFAAEVLREAARRGVTTNVSGAEGLWWRKDVLELALRSYTRETGREIARPRTYVVGGQQVPLAVERVRAAGAASIIKPARGSRAEGIQVVSRTGPWSQRSSRGNFVVQRLAARPLLAAGHKFDLRTYVLIDTLSRERSRWLKTIFARRAITRFVAGKEPAEITNTAYRVRRGLRPSIVPLDALRGLNAIQRATLTAGVDALCAELLDALFWWTSTAPGRGGRRPYTRRVLFWGVDVLAFERAGRIGVSLLEVNVYPALYRGVGACDREVDQLMRRAMLPALARQRPVRRVRTAPRRPRPAPTAPFVTLLTTRTRHRTARALLAAWRAAGIDARVAREVLPGTGAALHWGLDSANRVHLLRRAADTCRRAGVVLVNPRIIDKWSQLERLRAAAIPVPESERVASVAEALAAAERLGYPVVLKPLYGSYSSGIVCARTARELYALWRPRHRIVQARVREGNRCARILVIGDEAVHAVTRVARDGFHATYAHGRMARLEPFAGDDDDLRTAVAAARALGIGIAGVDLVQTAAGPRILEANHRGVEFSDAALHGRDAVDRVAAHVAGLARLAVAAAA